MTVEEMRRIVEIAASLGITKVKLTGGEPLLRRDILDIVSEISAVEGIEEVAMTTNGTLLSGYAYKLAEAGLNRINVTVNTLDRKVYQAITGADLLPNVLEGVNEAVKAGLNPVKVNMVLLRGLNEDEVWRLADYAGRLGAILQVIELEKTVAVNPDIYRRLHVALDKLRKQLEEKAIEKYLRGMQRRPRYKLPGRIEIELVQPVHNPDFCRHCNRIRVTSRGELKPCLLRSDNHVEILEAIRRGAGMGELKKLFLEAVDRREPYFK